MAEKILEKCQDEVVTQCPADCRYIEECGHKWLCNKCNEHGNRIHSGMQGGFLVSKSREALWDCCPIKGNSE